MNNSKCQNSLFVDILEEYRLEDLRFDHGLDCSYKLSSLNDILLPSIDIHRRASL
jgi:hypothetical protein